MLLLGWAVAGNHPPHTGGLEMLSAAPLNRWSFFNEAKAFPFSLLKKEGVARLTNGKSS
jgi:hypothetical protein